jgi:hypothetical protein
VGGGYGNTVPATLPNTSANLFSYDYDDFYQTYVLHLPNCASQGAQYCSQLGNFDVTFTAMWNGQPIYAVFSPDNTQDGGNVAGTFVGWEGIDPAGWSESLYDDHSSTEEGVLANIYVGSPRSTVPELSTWAMMLMGFAGLGYAGHRVARKRGAAVAA